MSAADVDPLAWLRLSALLDELLDLPDAEQQARLASIQASDAVLAQQLAALLERKSELAATNFLEVPALPAPASLSGRTVGAYVLIREIGHGGMGTVWLARRADGRYESQVAIKFMRAALLRPADSERFVREGQMLAKLDHPNIARLLDAGISQPAGQPFLVLDYVEGQPIDRDCEDRQLDVRARVRLVRKVLAAVAHAHSRLILHRDLKPSNILVTAEGEPKLLDFGVGKLLSEGSADGAGRDAPTAEDLTRNAGLAITARYAAPEQLQGQEVTTATDVYSLGVLMYGLLGGGHPTQGAHSTPLAQMQAVADVVPRRLSEAVLREARPGAKALARQLRGDLDTIVARALKKNPAERYANAAALSDDLRRWLDREPITARRDSAGYRMGRFVQRHQRIFMAAGTTGALALTAGAGLALWQAREAEAQRAKAESLVEFMLGDVKDKFDLLGRVDMMKAVGDRALAHYASDDLGRLGPDTLARRARALRVVAEAASLRLDGEQAQVGYQQAADTTARLLALAPDNVERLLDHAESLDLLDKLAVDRGNRAQSLVYAGQRSALLQRAAQRAPDQPELRRKAISAAARLAGSLAAVGQPEQALKALDDAERDMAALPAREGPPGLERVDVLRYRSTVLAHLGRYPDQLQVLAELLQTMAQMPTMSTDVWDKSLRRFQWRDQMRAHLSMGHHAVALAGARQIVAEGEAEPDVDPQNIELLKEVINDRHFLAQALWLAGNVPEARAELARAWALVDKAPQMSSKQLSWQFRTVGSLLALQARLQPTTPADMARMQAMLQIAQGQDTAAYKPLGLSLVAILEVGLLLGDHLATAGQPADATAHWQAVVRRAQHAVRFGCPPVINLQAQAQARLGDLAAARAGLNRLLAGSFRHPDMDDLQRRLAAAGPAASAGSAALPHDPAPTKP